MSEQHQPEDVRINNERSLQQLTWAIEASVGQFKLILARCNYASWRIRLIERSREISKVEIRVLVLKESAKTLYTAIREELGEEVPASLMVLGLESVGDLAQMLASANQVREEFRQNFHFPLVLWIDDEIHKQMMQFAPDLESWATTKSFALSPNELIDFLQQTAEQFFTISSTLSLEDCRQIKSAWQDLQNSGQVLKPEVKADCDFLLGLVEYIDNHVDIAIEYYLLSLAFWQQRNDLQRQGKLLENLTFCYYEKARKHLTERPQAGSLGLHEQSLPSQAQDNSNSDWEATINYLGQCLEVFEAAQRPDLVANSIDKFGIILRYLEDWEQLQKLAKRALQLHENEGNPIKIAQDYGFLAEVALAKEKWTEAKELAQKALEILSTISSESIPTQVNRPQPVETRRQSPQVGEPAHSAGSNFASLHGLHEQPQPVQANNSAISHRLGKSLISYLTSSYLFILARSQQHLDQHQSAVSNLEAARKIGVTDSDPQLYIEILSNLKYLYFQQKQYLEAFKAKLERRSIQQQFGLRAFIGAGRLEATRQVKLPQIVETRNFASPQEKVAPEITASGRQLDVERLLERIGRPDYKLIVIYGQSGVGKSSLVNAGLVPALKNKAIGTQDNLPVAIRVYTNWLEDLGRLLVEALAEKGIQPATDVVTDIADNLSVTSVTTSAAAILEQLQQTESHNQHWAQIFDQTDDVTDIADNLSVTSVTTSAAAILEQLQQTESHNLRPVLIFDQPDIANNLSVTSVTTSAAAILKQLRQTEQHNLRPVLIFDQFEEFFFVETEPAQRRQFFEFLGQCLNILPVKVILSLREDYLHYLLKCNRLPGISIIDIDILSKRVLYELGNFSPDDAKSIIQQLTERSHFHLEPALIDELVKDLAGNLEEVRPIELQVVGAQLQTDDITTLAEYEQRGPKEELVKRYLAEVVEDCGPENQQIAEFLLYLLTDEKGTRPLKTRAELEQDLQALGLTVETRLIASLQELDLVLLIFVKSGLVVLLPENPADRYQLVHDYIAAFIRQQQEPKLRAELETERKQRLLTEQQLKQSEQAQQILAEANQKAKQRIRIGSGVLVISVVVGGIAALFANQTYNLSKEAQTGTRLERQGVTAWQQFQFQETESLLSAMHAGQELQAIVKDGRPLEEYPAASPQFALQTILENIHEKNQLKGHTSGVYSASFSPDGKRIVTASWDNTARVWDLSGQQIAELKGHTGYVNSASFSPDGKRIVTASDDNTARVWDLSGQQIAELKGHTSPVYSASFSPDGKRIVTASDDNTARVWDLSGQQIAELKGHTSPVYSASFSPDGKRIVTASDDNTARVWDLSGQQIAELKGHTSPVYSASFSPDGKRIVTASDDNTARVWDLSGQQIAELKGHTGYVYSASFSPDGKRIVTASLDNTARVWDLSGQQIAELKGHTGYVYSASFSPDGKRIVTASLDNTARVWDLSGQQIAELKGHTGYVYSASFSPDGKRIVTASDDNTARVWDLSGQQIAELKGHTSPVYSASFSPDGKRIVTASFDNTARVWDLSGQQIAELKGHTSPVYSASFSPDGKRIVTASDDNTARVWDLSGQQIAELKGHTSPVYSASFSPDGKRIVTASFDNTARVWHVESLDELLSHGCAWLSDYLVIHPKDLETLELCQNKSNLKAAAPFLVKEGEAEARTGKIDEAVATFRTAFKWNPNLKLDPTAKAQEFANKGQAKRLVAEGVSLVKNGKIKEAVADYTKAQELDPKVEINADSWRSLCWYGSLRKQAADVMFACNKAVALSPKNSDSRGLARALTGNTQGAIEDFEAYIASTENKKGKSKVQQWVNSLRAGKNPFTDEELKSLLKQ